MFYLHKDYMRFEMEFHFDPMLMCFDLHIFSLLIFILIAEQWLMEKLQRGLKVVMEILEVSHVDEVDSEVEVDSEQGVLPLDSEVE